MPQMKSLSILDDPVALVGEVKLAGGAGVELLRDDLSNAIVIISTTCPPVLISMAGTLGDVGGISGAPLTHTIYHSFL